MSYVPVNRWIVKLHAIHIHVYIYVDRSTVSTGSISDLSLLDQSDKNTDKQKNIKTNKYNAKTKINILLPVAVTL